jgi:hypothetical protein
MWRCLAICNVDECEIGTGTSFGKHVSKETRSVSQFDDNYADLIAEFTLVIRRFRQYRISPISSVVTGQVDVRQHDKEAT